MKKTRILFEGHDLKFLTHVMDHFRVNHHFHVDVFTYEGHVIKDTREINRILPEIDIIFCEWGLGNLQWFSHHKLPGQKLITRIHLQEFSTSYLSDTKWENVDQIIVVGPFMKAKFDSLFPGVSEKCIVIPNLIDTASFDLPKSTDARFNLGLLGILPRRKAPHLAVEILRQLRKQDNRYRLFIKGRRAEEVDWVWRRPEEQEYFKTLYETVEKEGLQDAVIFELQGSDVQQWFKKIGFVLSPSEFESFHMAIAEGMASRAIPVIRNWAGSELLFPMQYGFSAAEEAVALIRRFSDLKAFELEGQSTRSFSVDNFDLRVILPRYDALMFPDIKPVELRQEYFTLLQQHQLTVAEAEERRKVLQKRDEELSALLQQQKSLVDNNTVLTSELKGLRSEFQQQFLLNQQLTGQLELLEKEIAHQRATDLQKMTELQGKQSEFQELTIKFKQLQEQSYREKEEASMRETGLKQQIADIRAEHASFLQSLRAGFESERQLLKEGYEREHRILVGNSHRETELIRIKAEQENNLIREMSEKENIRLANQLFSIRSEHAEHVRRLEYENRRLQEQIDALKNTNIDLERRLIRTFSSMTWKVGAILIKKPGDLLLAIKRRLLPSK